MTALAQIRTMLFNLRQPQSRFDRDEVVRCLEGIEASLAAEMAGGGRPRGSGLSPQRRETLDVMLRLGGAGTPMQIGNAIDPSLDGYRAGALAGTRLSNLKAAGLVRKVHFGWWEITDEGRAAIGDAAEARV